MAKKKASSRRAPGRPRSDTSRSAILKAAYQMLREGGFAQFTVEGVAARAGAGKATIYRWWSNKGTLAVEAFLVAVAPRMDALKPTEDPLDDLRQHLHTAAGIYRGRAGQLIRELLALGHADEETGRLLFSGYLNPRREGGLVVLRRVEAAGLLRPGVDLDVLADALWGPIFHRLVVSHSTLERAFIDSLLNVVLEGALKR
ncbi:MAG: TetR/AcrR family transcriptional regulator [Steroidobacteraceae bacterium]